jgi:hypothetical protein
MAKKLDLPVIDGEKKVPALSDILRKEKNLVTYSMGVDPTHHIPVDSIGYEVMIANAGFPVNCISLAHADAHAGKTTHSHVLGNWFSRAGGDVILAESDGVLDEGYIGRFYDFNPQTEDERFEAPLKYFVDALEEKLDSEKPKDGIIIPAAIKARLRAQKILAEADKLSAPEICNPLRMIQAKSQTIFCKRPK